MVLLGSFLRQFTNNFISSFKSKKRTFSEFTYLKEDSNIEIPIS
ncbi:hypothetical protein SAMN05216503_1741 [Polaribacter sp. KT25b]|nr:hypothetical protein [Polaribacter sp. KT25b]SDS02836.1 hypothetical protein SAMN05216503_1741 [Polaribacter sp. KT25b]